MSYNCCCIPVRVGVLVFSPVVLVISVLLSVLQFHLVLNDQMGAAMDSTNKALIGLSIGLSLLTVLGSILGWLGAALRKRPLVVFYGVALWLNWLAMLGVGIAFFVLQQESGSAEKKQCTDNVYQAADGKNDYAMWLAKSYCRGAYGLVLAIAIAAWVLLLALLLCLCIMTSKYSSQLRAEANVRDVKHEAEESCDIPASEQDANSIEYKTLHLPQHGARGSMRYGADLGNDALRPSSAQGISRGAAAA